MKMLDVVETKDGRIGAIVHVYSADDFEIEYMDETLETISRSEIAKVIPQ
ncbi:hypothetical protein DFP94_101539 [Fontibacillus phaseoli]|uniref:DUF4926 domain-containing protein n=1 Tax=Fontibacillus phaseoli TaxID=1416533 RepID=A0A369BMX8_9BACL|nr:DUF4926 domain-containing protein [Fontibacillus phaseoli]RCX22950.1 hypothetical protein DFP94_101539 [Fontibacillus phaseoli]